MSKRILSFFAVVTLFTTLGLVPVLSGTWGCGGGGGGGGDDDDADDNSDDDAGTASISGTAAVSADDAAAALQLAPGSAALRALAVSHVKTQAEDPTALPNADVALVQISPDGTETEVATTTTDAAGAYSFTGIEVATGGTGAATDFYYEVRVTTDGGIDVRAPAAPTGDETVDVTPETNLAAKVLSDVVDAPGLDDQPTPTPDYVNAVRELVDQNASDLSDSITIPSVLEAGADSVIDTANGLSAAGGNAENMYKAAQFNSEFAGITAALDEFDSDDAAAYLKRIAREGCGQSQDDNVLPIIAAEALGEVMMDGTTFTPTEIAQAFNDLVPDNQEIDAADAVTDFQEILTGIDDTFAAGADGATEISDSSLFALLTKREVDGDAFTADTGLEADQAVAFMQALVSGQQQQQQPPPLVGKAQQQQSVCQLSDSVTSVVAALLENAGIETDTDLGDPAIADVEIYHDEMGGPCPGDVGHFRAIVDVYIPGDSDLTVDSVSVSSTDNTALGGDGEVELEAQAGSNHYTSPFSENAGPDDAGCVSYDEEVTYTVTATLSDNSTVTDTVTRNHPMVPEAQTYFGEEEISGDANNPDPTPDARPVVTWDSPESTLAMITNAPAGSAVKYSYEFSHIQIVSNENQAPLSQSGCNSVSSEGQLYAVDNFIPTVDCDVQACATAVGTTPSNIACRFNIQTFLVDENDQLLGQAAGEFSFFCVDTNEDGDCGE